MEIIRAFEFIVNWFKHFLYDRKECRDPFSTYELSQIFLKFINCEEQVDLVCEDFNRMFFLFFKFLFENTETKIVDSELKIIVAENFNGHRTFSDYIRIIDCINETVNMIKDENKIIFDW